jgi:hypothetical protein
LPHSEIPGSTIARISPGLFAACHVLHRLSVPRHPPDALTLRLSATPNGKDHDPDDRHQESGIRTTKRGKLSSQKTLHAGSQARPFGRARSPATVTQLASLRLSINTAPAPRKGGQRQIRVFSPRRRTKLPIPDIRSPASGDDQWR